MRAQHGILRFAAYTSLCLAASVALFPNDALAFQPDAQARGGISRPTRPPAIPVETTGKPSFSPYVDGGAVLPPGFFLSSVDLSATTPSFPETSSTYELGFRVGLGLADRLAADATMASVELAPDAQWRGPTFGMIYNLASSYPFEFDPTVHVQMGVGGEPLVKQVEPGFVMILRGGHVVRFDTGAYAPVSFDEEGGETTVGLNVPARFAVQITPHIHAGVNTGATIEQMRDVRGSTAIPLGVSAGYVAPVGKGAIVVVLPSLSWPDFITPWSAQPVQTRRFVVGVTAVVVGRR